MPSIHGTGLTAGATADASILRLNGYKNSHIGPNIADILGPQKKGRERDSRPSVHNKKIELRRNLNSICRRPAKRD